MNINYIEYILEVTENDFNVTKTAKSINISQPALSNIIANFEADINTSLFTRNKGRLTGLTEAGNFFVKKAPFIIDAYQELIHGIEQINGNLDNKITLGISTSLLNVMNKNLLKKIFIEKPHVQLEIIEMPSRALEKKFIDKELDLLITLQRHSIPEKFYDSITLTSQKYGVMLDSRNPLSQLENITWEDLDGMIIALPPYGYITEQLVREKLELHRVVPQRIITVSSSFLLTEITIGTDIITILPDIFSSHLQKNTQSTLSIPLKDEMLWNVNLLINKENYQQNNFLTDFFHYLGTMNLFD